MFLSTFEAQSTLSLLVFLLTLMDHWLIDLLSGTITVTLVSFLMLMVVVLAFLRGVFINNAGFCLIIYFFGFLQSCSNILLAKLYVINKGLLLAKDTSIDELVCYSNSLYCINLIEGQKTRYHLYATLIQEIKNLLFNSNVSVSHTFQEGNHCSDFMARLRMIRHALSFFQSCSYLFFFFRLFSFYFVVLTL